MFNYCTIGTDAIFFDPIYYMISGWMAKRTRLYINVKTHRTIILGTVCKAV